MLQKMVIRFRFMTRQKYCCVIRFNIITMQFNNSTKQHSNSQELFEAYVWSFKFIIGQAFLSFVQSQKHVGDRQAARQAGMNMQQWRCDLLQQAAIQSIDAITQVKCMSSIESGGSGALGPFLVHFGATGGGFWRTCCFLDHFGGFWRTWTIFGSILAQQGEVLAHLDHFLVHFGATGRSL